MDQTLKKNSTKRTVCIMVKGQILKAVNITKVQIIQVMKHRLKLKIKTIGKIAKIVGQIMKKKTFMKKKLYQAMIKAPLTLQRRMTGHYERRNHFARQKLKTTQNEGPTPNDEEKDSHEGENVPSND